MVNPALQTARTWIQSNALFGMPLNIDDLSTSTIHYNQPAEAGNRQWVGQTVAALLRSRHSSVALPAWVGCPAARRTNWTVDVKTEACELLQTITETINTLFPVVNFFKMCCYRSRLAFNCSFEKLDISQSSVATHLRCDGIFSDSIITNFLLILTVK